MIHFKSRIWYTNNVLDDGNNEPSQPRVDQQACTIKQKLSVKSPPKAKRTNSPKPSIPCKRHASIDRTQAEQNSTRIANDMELDGDGSVLTAKECYEIRIGDDEAVKRYLNQQLELISQQALKGILKAWIKATEEKKQSRHPYNSGNKAEKSELLYGEGRSGEISKPYWWPGPECRHKEPDHLYKKGKCPSTILFHLF